MASSRIYLVHFNDGSKNRLVDASSQWQAMKHCMKGMLSAKAATAKDVAAHVITGGTIEDSLAATVEIEQPSAAQEPTAEALQ